MCVARCPSLRSATSASALLATPFPLNTPLNQATIPTSRSVDSTIIILMLNSFTKCGVANLERGPQRLVAETPNPYSEFSAAAAAAASLRVASFTPFTL